MALDVDAVRERLAEKSVNANYSSFFVGGLALAVVGARAVPAVAARAPGATGRGTRSRSTGSSGPASACGRSAITAVHKIVGRASGPGVIIRLSQATAFFIPVSLVGLLLIMTVGYHDIYGNMTAALPGMSPGKARWLSHSWMAIRMFAALGVLYIIGDQDDQERPAARSRAGEEQGDRGRAARASTACSPGYDEAANHERIYRLAGDVRAGVRLRA